jgi:hypothetical protein
MSRLERSDEAKKFAELALKTASVGKPQFPRHPSTGIPRASEEMLSELRSIAEGQKKSRLGWKPSN